MYGAPFGLLRRRLSSVFQSYFPLGGEYFPSFAVTVGKGIDPEFTSGGGHGKNQGMEIGQSILLSAWQHETFPSLLDKGNEACLWNAAVRWCAKRT